MKRIEFKVNGIEYTVGCEVSSDVTLLDYIRNTLQLKGTKYMCREAGCGACIVNVKRGPAKSYAVNSCMISITSCHGWEIITIEEVGNKMKGYHPLQTTLAKDNGTQCGYCSPAWVMSMYSIIRSKPDITMLELEKSFGSNVCRCTGYRPILEAFKKFAKDAPKQIQLPDIEDLHICKKNGEACNRDTCEESDWCFIDKEQVENDVIEIRLKDKRLWVRANTINDIFRILKREGDDSYMLVCGNTAKGAYPIIEYPRVLIDVNGIPELKGYHIDQNLIINANTTLSDFLDIMQTVSKERYFKYLLKLYDHIQNVAHIPVRNIGSIAGNLMIKHQHNWFSSDIFLLLETVGAQLTIQRDKYKKITVTMQEFLKIDMRGQLILNIMFPPLTDSNILVTFKIMPRSQNAKALINAGFLYKISKSDNIVKQARIVYGALSPSFIRATNTERYLVGKQLFSTSTLQSALKIMEKELHVEPNPPAPSVEYRKQVALGLFYKGLLQLCPEKYINSPNRSGAVNLSDIRPVSKASQVYDTKPSQWPLTQPLMKVEATIQCSGEAFYTDDMPTLPREVFCSFALSTIAVGDIFKIDSSKALAYPGVVAVYTASDIPGLNSFTPSEYLPFSSTEEVLCSGSVKYFNQPIAIVVAETRYIADRAAKLVTAIYKNVKDPILNVKDTIGNSRSQLFTQIDATETGRNVTKKIQGTNTIYSQYHFTMETLVCITKPSDQGLDVYCSSQWLDVIQIMISRALIIEENRINVHNRRVGGAYGIKLTRCIQGAVANALVVSKLNRPCRFIQSLSTNMRAVGKRLPCALNYEVGVDNSGVIQYLNYNLYSDNGYKLNELFSVFGLSSYYNAYKKERWNYKYYVSLTDTAKNSWTRAPGSLEHIAMSELVMEQISYEMAIDPVQVRLANLDNENFGDLRQMAIDLMISADYKKRREIVDKFNLENRWKKRGLRVSFLQWTPLLGFNMSVNLAVFHDDGTVAITHAGCEMGQGINTRAVQIAAYLLDISVDKIIIKENSTTISPNSSPSGASISSLAITIGVTRACRELLKNIQPIREQMKNPSWVELIQKAYANNVPLQTQAYTRTDETFPYPVFGVTIAEVEVDIITGESQILKVDLCEDAGQSINPLTDIGQIEGAFIMGVGYWTCENLVNSPMGEVLTDRSWNYHVPLARDIPQDWNVYLKKSSYSNSSVYGSKCVGEPPICMAIVIALAIREAVVAARRDAGIPTTQWYPEDGPYTVEKTCLLSSIKIEDFKF